MLTVFIVAFAPPRGQFRKEHRVMTRYLVVALVSALGVGVASGQVQRSPATLDHLLAEIQGMRGDVNRAANASLRMQLLVARMTAQEIRMMTAGQQLESIRQQLAESRIRLAPSTEQIRPALETNSQILAPLRHTVQEEQRRTSELQRQEAALWRLIEAEQGRLGEFNSRLDDLERALSR
jgi:hypothetical protein